MDDLDEFYWRSGHRRRLNREQLLAWSKNLICERCNVKVEYKWCIFPPPGHICCGYCSAMEVPQDRAEVHARIMVDAYFRSVGRTTSKKKRSKFNKSMVKCLRCKVFKKGTEMSLPDSRIVSHGNHEKELVVMICEKCSRLGPWEPPLELFAKDDVEDQDDADDYEEEEEEDAWEEDPAFAPFAERGSRYAPIHL